MPPSPPTVSIAGLAVCGSTDAVIAVAVVAVTVVEIKPVSPWFSAVVTSEEVNRLLGPDDVRSPLVTLDASAPPQLLNPLPYPLLLPTPTLRDDKTNEWRRSSAGLPTGDPPRLDCSGPQRMGKLISKFLVSAKMGRGSTK